MRAAAATELTTEEVKPIQTDYHFFVKEHKARYLKLAEEEVRASIEKNGGEVGDKLDGFIKKIREDGRIDLMLAQKGKAGSDDLSDRIVAELQAAGGELPLGDKSDPEAIKAAFGVSKSAWKKALGGLYKARVIKIERKRIELL